MAAPDAAPITSFSAPSGLHFDTTIGIYVISPIVNAVLYGTLCLQVYNFFQKFEDEGPLLKYSVVAVWLLDTLHLAFMVQTVYTWTVTNFGNVDQLAFIPWPISTSIIVTSITIALVQAWFCYRVWMLSAKNKILTYPLILVIIATMCISLVHNGRLYTLHTVPNFSKQVGLYFAELGAFVVSDFYIAVSLCYLLYKQRKHTRVRATRSMLNTLMLYTVQTGLLTSFVSLISLITCATMPNNLIFVGIYLLLSESYSNCLMASLNARSAFRNEPQIVSIPLATRNGLALHSSRDDDETVRNVMTGHVVAVEQESSVTGTEGKGKGTLNL